MIISRLGFATPADHLAEFRLVYVNPEIEHVGRRPLEN